VQIFPNGNGDGSTTFNLPNCQGVTLAGRPNMSGSARGNLTSTYFGTNPNALGASGGAQSDTLVTANLPPYTPAGTVSVTSTATDVVQGTIFGSTPSGGPLNGLTGASDSALTSTGSLTGTAQGGTSTPFSTIQPTLTANCMIRALAMISPSAPSSLAANDNGLPIVADRRRLIG
jgi:microcystin-dependent protein